VIAMQTTERNGQLVAATQVATTDELMLMSSNGTLVRTRAGEISVLGRNTQGVRLIRLDDGERLIGVEPVEPESDEEGDGDAEGLAAGETDAGAAGEPSSPA
jgi:DNA gyrase subunit A